MQQVNRLDLGPLAELGVPTYPAREGEPYAAIVSALDQDGNEVAGVRLPDLSVPVGTHTGWNLRDPESGGSGRMAPYFGTTRFFARTKAEQRADGDPRTSLDQRYASRHDYETRVSAATDALIAQRYVLPEDRGLVIENCLKRYDMALERD